MVRIHEREAAIHVHHPPGLGRGRLTFIRPIVSSWAGADSYAFDPIVSSGSTQKGGKSDSQKKKEKKFLPVFLKK
jgi:hypothetical protein